MFPPFKTVFCVASGPSLTLEDCQAIEQTGFPVIAVNNTWQLFKSPYAVYAGDLEWWTKHAGDLPTNGFRRVTANYQASIQYDLEYRRYCASDEKYNSGAMAIDFAAELGAKTIILVGYDCSLRDGHHWHGSHIEGLRNPTELSVERWKTHFEDTRKRHLSLDIINASRRTDLTCFPLKNLNKAIAALSSQVDPAPKDLSHQKAFRLSP